MGPLDPVSPLTNQKKSVGRSARKPSVLRTQKSNPNHTFIIRTIGLFWMMSKERPPEPLDFFIWTVEKYQERTVCFTMEGRGSPKEQGEPAHGEIGLPHFSLQVLQLELEVVDSVLRFVNQLGCQGRWICKGGLLPDVVIDGGTPELRGN
ncbi:unnamed protein product [Ilex paraguariensis]|uniref:Uncharacterized protein n=1 Tax=Ilex paraguariensis TaxID=185542 RepID=A0ABC8QL61_9AQUA